MLTFENAWEAIKILTFQPMYCTPDSVYLDNFTINYWEDEVLVLYFNATWQLWSTRHFSIVFQTINLEVSRYMLLDAVAKKKKKKKKDMTMRNISTG